MNKGDLVDIAAQKADVSKADAARVLEAVIEAIVDSVADGDTVTLVGFGSFKAVDRAERSGVNPQTGAKLTIPATTVPRFSPGANFKSAVADG